jgi:hypothetical protein
LEHRLVLVDSPDAHAFTRPAEHTQSCRSFPRE